MVDGASLLMTMFHGMRASGHQRDVRGESLLDTGAPFYDTYETADGRHVAVGAIEPQFYAELLERLGLEHEALPSQMDRSGWPTLRARFAEVFKTKPLVEWQAHFETSDACVTPVLSIPEAIAHPHAQARTSFVTVEGVAVPAPAPRFSRTPCATPSRPRHAGEDGSAALTAWGFGDDEIGALRANDAIA
jgi:alpha-methylacyl-CoA racemase